MTTGPGVIIATATASRNCLSVSQWNWPTTPPYRNGTIAKPLPNTNAPALRKYKNTEATAPVDTEPASPPRIHGPKSGALARLMCNFGGALTNIATNPDNTNSQTTSDCVQTVVIANAPKRIHTK